MKKKLFKYIKFLVSLTLILSFVAPSYASLSASDGSAFVTKAEFDSALADFNARLTTFEAGINSKIDSQVTSYLDRNGIWSGKAQLVTNQINYEYGFKCGTTVRNMRRFEIDSTSPRVTQADGYGISLVANYNDSKWSDNESAYDNKIWIENINKSGLLIAELTDVLVQTDDIRCRVWAIDSILADDCFKAYYTMYVGLKLGGITRWSKEVSWNANAGAIALACPTLGSGTVLFFVAQGDTVEYEIKEDWLKSNGAASYETSLMTHMTPLTGGVSRKATRRCQISQPSVY